MQRPLPRSEIHSNVLTAMHPNAAAFDHTSIRSAQIGRCADQVQLETAPDEFGQVSLHIRQYPTGGIEMAEYADKSEVSGAPGLGGRLVSGVSSLSLARAQ